MTLARRHFLTTTAAGSAVFGGARMVEEFLFVPKPDRQGEADSWLVGPVLNLKTGASEICVFDAARVNDGPVCFWRGDRAWPLGFHGA